ncbi:MAG: glycosyltransferase family protein [Sulfuritalea sp.]|nr:glycosyltransferase family protein [Sulfuritalea sp.]
MSVGVIIQARMGSTRLPGKTLMPIGRRVLLDHVFDRLLLLRYPVQIIVATSNCFRDDIIESHCKRNGVAIFRGSELDVLDRYYQCAKQHCFDHVVRLTADNPFTDIDELHRLIELHLNNGNDYTHSFGVMPLGVGAEVFTFNTLERSAREGLAANHREHVNEYVQENPKRFRIGTLPVANEKRCAELRLTVDTEEDYRRACRIVSQIPNRWIGTEEAIRICSHFA